MSLSQIIVEFENHVKNGGGAGEPRSIPVSLICLRSRPSIEMADVVRQFEEEFGHFTGFDYDGDYLFEFQFLKRNYEC